jgi:hypothetical protein
VVDVKAAWERYLARPDRRTIDYDANAYDTLREAAYTRLFGAGAARVMVEAIPSPPFVVTVHILEPPAVTIVPPTGSPSRSGRNDSLPPRSWTTLATMGMSNERMAVPPGMPPGLARTELLFYLSERAVASDPDMIHFCGDVLMYLAKYPFLEETWVGPGHIVPVCAAGVGPVRFFRDDSMTRLVLLSVPDNLPESQLPQRLQLAGDPVSFLLVTPMTDSELAFVRAHGLQALIEGPGLPLLYDGPRA